MENKKEIDDIQLLADIKAVVGKHGAVVSNYIYSFKDENGRYCLDLEVILPKRSVLP